MAWVIDSDRSAFVTTPFLIEPSEKERRPTEEERNRLQLRKSNYGLFNCGQLVPARFFPKRALSKSKRKTWPHITDWQFLGFSIEMRDLVEKLEPGRHQFEPVEIVRTDATFSNITIFAVNIMTTVNNAIDFERSEALIEAHLGSRWISLRDRDCGTVKIRRQAIEGKHVWMTKEIAGRPLTISDILFEEMKNRKMLRGMRTRELVEI